MPYYGSPNSHAREVEFHKRQDERRDAEAKALQRREDNTTSKVTLIALGHSTTAVTVEEYFDRGYKIASMNESVILMVHKGGSNAILKQSKS